MVDSRQAAAIEAHFRKRVQDMTRPEQYAALAWEIAPRAPEANAGRIFRGASGAYGAGSEFSHAVERHGSVAPRTKRAAT